VFKPSRRAFGIATIFTLSAVCFAPAASAGLLGGSDGGNSGGLPVLSNGPLGGDLLGGLLGGDLLGGDGGLPVVGDLLGGGGGGLPLVGGPTSVDGADRSG